MSLNKLFDTIEEIRETANWRAAFGEPQVVEDKTIIPLARVGYGFGLGFASSTGQPETEGEPPPEGEGGGGGGAWTKPLGAIVVTPEEVYFEGRKDLGMISLAGMVLGGVLLFQLGKTLRVIFGRD
jgi:uncharacterized spore protein YtfJ